MGDLDAKKVLLLFEKVHLQISKPPRTSEDMRQILKDAWGSESKGNPYGPTCLGSIFTENKGQLRGTFWEKLGICLSVMPKVKST